MICQHSVNLISMAYGYAGVLTNMLTKRVRYTFNRGGYYYFTRRAPNDLQQHYLCPRIVQGLNTKCSSKATTRALVAAAKLDEYWSHLRLTDPKLMKQLQPNLLRSETCRPDHITFAGVPSVQSMRLWSYPDAL